MIFKQGDIVLIPVPFTDLSSSKKRPVLIISSNIYNELTEDIIVLAITSNLKIKKYCIDIDDKLEKELPKKSQIRTDKIYTLSKNIVIKTISHATENFVIKTIKSLNEIFT